MAAKCELEWSTTDELSMWETVSDDGRISTVPGHEVRMHIDFEGAGRVTKVGERSGCLLIGSYLATRLEAAHGL